MKMADNQLMSLPNNCGSNNRNDVEVKENIKKGYNSETISMIHDNMHIETLKNSSDISTQEEAVEEFLAGDNKSEYNNDLLSNMEEDEEEILFKADRFLECGNEQLEQRELYFEREKSQNSVRKNFEKNYMAKSLKKRSIRCLNKMQIMEDVREGCNVQPSSPGHADQGEGDVQVQDEVKSEVENGHDEQKVPLMSEDLVIKEEGDSQESETVEPKEEVIEENYSDASSPNGESNKRRLESDDLPTKRLKSDIHENFASRDRIITEFIEMADCQNLEQIQAFSEQLLAEVKTLNELAKEKEREWNNIIHLKKLKEELLLRMQRKRQILILNDKSDYSDILNESQNDSQDERIRNNLPQSILKTNLISGKSSLRIPNISMNGDRTKTRIILPKPPQQTLDLNGSLDFRQKQRPTLDVQSIIADYRQRHPETVPRRGRRIRTSQSEGTNKTSGSILNFSSMALGSGSQVRHNLQSTDVSNELGILLNSVNMNRPEGIRLPNADSSVPTDEAVSFKDMLQQFAKLSQSERNELIQNAIKPPPPYPEVTVLPVPTTTVAPTNSLLHGILTKSPTTKQSTKTSFSPTLARLLTAPERNSNSHTSPQLHNSTTSYASNMSISEILSSSKARNEITITPVDAQYESAIKGGRSMDEEEAEDSADRLVIDESSEAIDARKSVNADNNSDNGDEIPQCQGCNQKPAQFVCAGCGNQWYCSRDCQVSAWDEHSEVCSG